MDAEQIVRALAKEDPPGDLHDECSFCGGELERYFIVGYADNLEPHEPDCPWRLAREWVATGPG